MSEGLPEGEVVFEINVQGTRMAFKPIPYMTLDELRAECAMWRQMFFGVDDATRALLLRLGKEIVLIQRNYQAVTGLLLALELQPKAYIIGGITRYYDVSRDRWRTVIATQRIEAGTVFSYITPTEELKEEEGKPPAEVKETVEEEV